MNSSKKNLLQWYQELGTDYFMNETPQDRSKIQQKSVKKEFKENVNLIVQDLTGYNIDLNQYVEISENQIKTMITDGNIISSERVKKDEKEFQRVIYTGKQGIYDLKFEQYYWVENNNAYVLTLTCEITAYTDFKNTGEKILNSFEISKN